MVVWKIIIIISLSRNHGICKELETFICMKTNIRDSKSGKNVCTLNILVWFCQQHATHYRTQKILALVPKEHAPSETSEKSCTNSDDEVPSLHSSLASSPARSIDSSLERLHILSSDGETYCDDNDYQNDANVEEQDKYEHIPLTPILHHVYPTSLNLPQYDNIPSLSSLPSLDSVNPTPTSSAATRLSRKTRSKKILIAPAAKKQRKVKKFVLSYKWKKAVFRHRATIEENDSASIQSPEEAPIDYFFKFLSPDIITDITDQTNIYSVQTTGKSIQLTQNELQDFLAIHILMGIVQMPSYLDYWSQRFRFGQVAEIMPLKRYQQIRRFLHFVDNNLEDSDRYYKIRHVAEKVRRNCLQMENGNKFSIDEMIIAYKGRKAGNRWTFRFHLI